ncbi:reverse transcriptase family protein [bacterium]|nr:reverse transcriptase family protein [bacterium]
MKKKEVRNKTRSTKAERRAYFQRLYVKNKSRLIDELAGDIGENIDPPPIHIAIKHYEQIWSTTQKKINDVCHSFKIQNLNNNQILSPISRDEINAAIRQTKNDTAKGLDGITIQEARRLAEHELFIAFNIWLSCNRIPRDLKRNKTTLLPKGNTDLDKISNWRPITISSILLRLYNKILRRRLERITKTDDRQLGFKPLNGCSMNIHWLHNIIKHARLHRRDMYVCLIDVAKAFDSVPHTVILEALEKKNVPQTLITIIQDQYEQSSTSLSYKELSSKAIMIKKGVKQGDPLSPLLFNLVMDELLERIGDQFGYSIEDIGSTNIKCFADDICLISGSRMGLQQLIDYTDKFLDEKGLTINARKCITIGLAKGYKGKKSKIITENIFSVKQTPIPMLGHIENETKYLGINFTSMGTEHIKTIRIQFEKITQKLIVTPLKPHQKINLIRSFIIPRFIYKLTNIEIYPESLKKLDIYIRKIVRTILHLPQSLSTEFYGLPIREGGLQIPILSETIGTAKIKIYKSIMRSKDNILKYLMEIQGFKLIRRFMTNLGISESFEANEIEQRRLQILKEHRLSLLNKVHGHGNEVFGSCALTNTWLKGEFETMKGRTFINSIKLRTNTIETRVTQSRGQTVEKMCRRCHTDPESIMHILQFCNSTRGLRCERHDRICTRVAQKLKERGFNIIQEKRFVVPNDNLKILKPDLIVIKNNKVNILDVQVVYETSGAAFSNAYQRKVEKYTQLIPLVRQEFKCESVEIHGLIIGARGSFLHNHINIWRALEFTNTDLQFLAIHALENSLRIIYSFWKSLGAGGNGETMPHK